MIKSKKQIKKYTKKLARKNIKKNNKLSQYGGKIKEIEKINELIDLYEEIFNYYIIYYKIYNVNKSHNNNNKLYRDILKYKKNNLNSFEKLLKENIFLRFQGNIDIYLLLFLQNLHILIEHCNKILLSCIRHKHNFIFNKSNNIKKSYQCFYKYQLGQTIKKDPKLSTYQNNFNNMLLNIKKLDFYKTEWKSINEIINLFYSNKLIIEEYFNENNYLYKLDCTNDPEKILDYEKQIKGVKSENEVPVSPSTVNPQMAPPKPPLGQLKVNPLYVPLNDLKDCFDVLDFKNNSPYQICIVKKILNFIKNVKLENKQVLLHELIEVLNDTSKKDDDKLETFLNLLENNGFIYKNNNTIDTELARIKTDYNYNLNKSINNQNYSSYKGIIKLIINRLKEKLGS